MKRLALFVVILAVSFAQAESKGKVCIWVDSEVPGAIVGAQTGGSVSSVTAKEVAAIQTSATEALKTDKSNVVVSPCPQSGENIELDVVVGKFRGGYLQSVIELVHADIFADFLDMAEYLLQQGYKDPAAVVTGSVVEAHLRKLCNKHGIAVVKSDGSAKKADALNSELAAGTVYSKLDQKSVTAWLDLRNKAAHGKYDEYTKEQVAVMLQGVRDFASRYPA